jgi:DNA adenine methylase
MKPLIKYTGGKYKEYDKIKQFFPTEINNYYEPFFGGGGVFFRLKNENKISGESYINDFSKSLIDFYKSVSGNTIEVELYKISDAWDLIREIADDIYEKYHQRFEFLLSSIDNEPFVNKEILTTIKKKVSKIKLNTHGFLIPEKIEKCLNAKLKRFKNSDITGNIEQFVYKSITTSICQAFYFIVRDMYNDWNNHGNENNYTMDERSAQWVFIREFCFGSMFRFSANGDFNIPYGGFSYNSKCFTCKIENITSEEVKNAFSQLHINCGDFEEAINSWNFSENDFMFLDPPYDSTFTDYDDNSFGKEEHIRLSNCLKQCKCKWLMAIGKTDFIYNLYKITT